MLLTEPVDKDLSRAGTRVDQGVEGRHHVSRVSHRLGGHGFQGVTDVVKHNWVSDDFTKFTFQCAEAGFHVGWCDEPGEYTECFVCRKSDGEKFKLNPYSLV